MIRAVLDTNVIVSALFWKGPPYSVLHKGISRDYVILISPKIIEEVFTTLAKEFNFPASETRGLLEIVTANAEIVIPTRELFVVKRDPKR